MGGNLSGRNAHEDKPEFGVGEWHIGRTFNGPDPEWFTCDCPRTACGLTVPDEWIPGCLFHNFSKTIRQSHPASACHQPAEEAS